MVSAGRFASDEPALFQSTVDFVQLFCDVPDPVLAVTSKIESLDARIAWTLLGTDLFQDRSYGEIGRLLSALYERFPGDKLWTLPVPTGPEIEAVVESTFGSRNWSLFKNVAGIFWSVGLFVRRHPDLESWVRERTANGMWRDLGEIYFMGKNGPRVKACAAIYRLIAPRPLGLGLEFNNDRRLPPLPLTMGSRRFIAMLGPAREGGFAEMEPAQKQALANDFFVQLVPGNPYAAAHALQFYLEEGCEDFICRERTKECALCPLKDFCDYAVHHD